MWKRLKKTLIILATAVGMSALTGGLATLGFFVAGPPGAIAGATAGGMLSVMLGVFVNDALNSKTLDETVTIMKQQAEEAAAIKKSEVTLKAQHDQDEVNVATLENVSREQREYVDKTRAAMERVHSERALGQTLLADEKEKNAELRERCSAINVEVGLLIQQADNNEADKPELVAGLKDVGEKLSQALIKSEDKNTDDDVKQSPPTVTLDDTAPSVLQKPIVGLDDEKRDFHRFSISS